MMKTLKLLIAVCIVGGFTVATANAQMQGGDKVSALWTFESEWFGDCVGETLTGYIEYDTYTMWKEDPALFMKWQDRYRGVFVGDITGTVYKFIETDNHHHVSNPNTFTLTEGIHFNIIRRGDGLIGTGHILVHLTWNTQQNDFTSVVEIVRNECK